MRILAHACDFPGPAALPRSYFFYEPDTVVSPSGPVRAAPEPGSAGQLVSETSVPVPEKRSPSGDAVTLLSATDDGIPSIFRS